MKNSNIRFLLFSLLIFIISCGNKKNASGGPSDLINPKLINSSPESFSRMENEIELEFSKPLDRSSVIHNIYIYPEVESKIKIKNNKVNITISDSLIKNTTYYVTLSDRIKGYHSNPLEESYTLLFHTGRLNSNKSLINFAYEKIEDRGTPIKYSIMAADSSVIFAKTSTSNEIELPYLSKKKHIIKAYIDKNKNRKYDVEKDPYCYEIFEPENKAVFSFELAYVDTTMAKIKSIKTGDRNKVEVLFSEDIKFSRNFRVETNDSLKTIIPIVASAIGPNYLKILIEPQDSLNLNFVYENLTDLNGNINSFTERQFKASSIADTLSPFVVSHLPRNGGVLKSLQPNLQITMSEIILDRDVHFELKSVEDNEIIDVDLMSYDSNVLNFITKHPLKNYSSYQLTIFSETKDVSKNKMEKDFSLVFLIVK